MAQCDEGVVWLIIESDESKITELKKQYMFHRARRHNQRKQFDRKIRIVHAETRD